MLALFLQHLQKKAVQEILPPLHAQGQDLRDQHIPETVHGQTGELIRLTENETAAAVVLSHDRAAVLQSIPDAPEEKSFVETIVGVPGEQTDADLAVIVHCTAAQPPPFFGKDVHDVPLGIFSRHRQDLFPVYPGMPGPKGPLRLGGYGESGITALHMQHLRENGIMSGNFCQEFREMLCSLKDLWYNTG